MDWIPKSTIQSLFYHLYPKSWRVMYEQSMEFLDKHKIVFKFQSGFQENYPTNFHLSYLTEKISNGFNSGFLTGMILIDLQKVFVTIDHYILLQKLPLLGFLNEVIDWFKLSQLNRTFYVIVNGKLSTTGE